MRGVAAFVLLIGVLPAGAGCSAGEDQPAVAQPSPSSAAPDELAVEAYEGLMAAIVEGSHRGATAHPDIARYATGQARSLSEEMLSGITATGEPDLAPAVVGSDMDADPPEVIIEDCVDDSEWLIAEDELSSLEGDLREGEGFRLTTATVVAEGGTWKVADIWLDEYGSCDR